MPQANNLGRGTNGYFQRRDTVFGDVNAMDRGYSFLHDIFFRGAVLYARLFPKPVRRFIECVFLVQALVSFLMLTYIHIVLAKSPVTCLDHIKNDWPRDGILRVELIQSGRSGYHSDDDQNLPGNQDYIGSNYVTEADLMDDDKADINPTDGVVSDPDSSVPEISLHPEDMIVAMKKVDLDLELSSRNSTLNLSMEEKVVRSLKKPYSETVSELESVAKQLSSETDYIIEYSLEYGFLRLSQRTRQKLNISVMVVRLDADKDACFGDYFSRFILDHVIGYDDLLLSSIKTLVEQEENKGYLRNVVSGEHFRFVSMWWMVRTSCPFAALLMLVFTSTVSIVLKYCHQQVFLFMYNLLQMWDFNVNIRVSAAPLIAVILALVGMETVMSEFFSDTATAFYIILIVWIADQYIALCCHTEIAKRYWPRFFYLYHYAFYAHHCRFNGQYNGLALIASWSFFQHSMLYFFHHYELPIILARNHVHQFFVRVYRPPDGQAFDTRYGTSEDVNDTQTDPTEATGLTRSVTEETIVEINIAREEESSSEDQPTIKSNEGEPEEAPSSDPSERNSDTHPEADHAEAGPSHECRIRRPATASEELSEISPLDR